MMKEESAFQRQVTSRLNEEKTLHSLSQLPTMGAMVPKYSCQAFCTEW